MPRLPNALLVGYQKAGTTFLRSYFEYHPAIHFTHNGILFQAQEDFPRYQSEYLAALAETTSPCYVDVGENITISYLLKIEDDWHSFWQKNLSLDTRPDAYDFPDLHLIPQRIKETLPGTKIIISLRSQVEWLRSNLLEYVARLPAKHRNFAGFLRTIHGKQVLAAGLFDRTLQIYFDIFGRDNVHVSLLEETRDDLPGSLKKVCGFLGVDYHPFPKDQWNTYKGRSDGLANLIRVSSDLGFYDTLKKTAPFFQPLRKTAEKLFAREFITAKEKSLIRSLYAASNNRSSELLGIDLGKYGYPI